MGAAATARERPSSGELPTRLVKKSQNIPCLLSGRLEHCPWLTVFFLGRKPGSGEPEGQAWSLLFGPGSGCQWPSRGFHFCPSWSCCEGGHIALRHSAGILSPQVTCRALGIGAYLVRLGQRVIQVENSHIILTGASALNKVRAKGPGVTEHSPRPLRGFPSVKPVPLFPGCKSCFFQFADIWAS